jgi:hypothetical protein
MCDSIAEGGARCTDKGHHDAAWYAAKRARARELYALRHPSKGGHGRKPLPADAGPPKKRPSKLNLGAAMMIDLSRGLGLGEAPPGHPSDVDREASNAVIRARHAVEVGDVEREAVVSAEAAEADALEAYRLASGSNPNIDRRPLHERRNNPLPGADHPDGRNWLAAQAKARSRLAIAKRVRAEAEAAYQVVMGPSWAAVNEAACAQADAANNARRANDVEAVA